MNTFPGPTYESQGCPREISIDRDERAGLLLQRMWSFLGMNQLMRLRCLVLRSPGRSQPGGAARGGRGLPGAGWVVLLVMVGVFYACPGIIAAATEGPPARIRKAVRLPTITVSFQFGFENSQDWLSEPEVADPAAEIVRLRSQLKGDLRDAVILAEIARATVQLGDGAARAAAGKESVAAWRKWAAAAPEDRTVGVGLAKALRLQLEYEEAETVLRKAIQGAEPSWELQYELATTLGELAFRQFYGKSSGDADSLSRGAAGKASDREKVARYLKEALQLADALVTSDPGNPRGWSRRARLLSNQGMIRIATQAEAASAGAEGMRRMYLAMLPEVAIKDLETAVSLRPNDPRLLMVLLMHRLAGDLPDLAAAAIGGTKGEGGGLAELSSAKQAAVGRTISALDRLGESADHLLAATALEHSAMLNLIVRGDRTRAVERARRAMRLGSPHQEAFSVAMLGTTRGENHDWNLAEEIVRERLRVKRDGSTWLFLVKILNEQGKPAPALEEAHAALKALPDDAGLAVAHMALHLRDGSFPGAGSESEIPNFAEIEKQISALPDGEFREALGINYLITSAVFVGLSGDSTTARKLAERTARQFPQDEYAKLMSELLKSLP